MKLQVLLFVAICTTCIWAKSESPCHEAQECDKVSEYQEYVKCMQEQDRKKRSAGCYEDDDDDDCDNCNCDACDSCQNSCGGCCGRCCNTVNNCENNNCCHKTCHATCKSNTCRSSCKKSCRENIRPVPPVQPGPTIVSRGGGETFVNNTIINKPVHNITTVIHLNNYINNTNVIDIPVQVNATTYNDITIQNEIPPNAPVVVNPGGNIQTRPPQPDNCCVVIGPRQCVRQDKFPFVRCFHIRKQTCGYICSAPIVHYQEHEVCSQPQPQPQPIPLPQPVPQPQPIPLPQPVPQPQPIPLPQPVPQPIPQPQPIPPPQSCRQQVIYVPQPQPRCAVQQNWPYVSCGGYQKQQPCEGCYNHYINSNEYSRCSPYCYDDGFGVGPYYRQGPFYRPGYAHAPSCYQTGLCGFAGGYGNYPQYPPPPVPYAGGPYGGGSYAGGPYAGAYPPPAFPFNGVGYPPNTYETPIIIDEANNTVTPIENIPWAPVNSSNEYFLNPIYSGSYPYNWGNGWDAVAPDVSIEARIEPARSERYAEIKIEVADDSKKEGGEEVATDDTEKEAEEPTTDSVSE